MADTLKSLFQDVKDGTLSKEDARRRATALDRAELTQAKFNLAVSTVGLALSTAAFIIDPTKLSAVGFAASSASFEQSASQIFGSSGNNGNATVVDLFAADKIRVAKALATQIAQPNGLLDEMQAVKDATTTR